jgi:hypothetical protein
MRKEVAILLFLLLIPLATAVEFDVKTSYNQGETVLAKLSGNFVEPVLRENILFYRQRIDGNGYLRVPMNQYDITTIEGEYYIYAQLPESSGNYSISVEGTRYYQGSKIADDSIVRYFTIGNQTVDFSIFPGFINTPDGFSVELQNLQDSKISVKINTATNSGSSDSFYSSFFGSVSDGNDYSVSLKSGEKKKVDFLVSNIKNTTFKTIKFSTNSLSYELPVLIFVNKTIEAKKQREIQFNPSWINVTTSTNSSYDKIIYIKNTGEENIENISLNLSENLKDFVTLSIVNIEELEENSSYKVELLFSSNTSQSLIGTLRAKADMVSETLDIYFNVIEGYIPTYNETEDANKTCTELGGNTCGGNACSGTEVISQGKTCCLGLCGDSGGGTSTGKIIGWILVLIIAGFLLWFFFAKYRGAKRPFNLLKRAEKGSRE